LEIRVTTVLLLVAGLVLLMIGAEILVRSASGLAVAVGVSPLVIGLTVVVFGTSGPELVVSLQVAIRDQADIALGNVVGSNIVNATLAVSAVRPWRRNESNIPRDCPQASRDLRSAPWSRLSDTYGTSKPVCTFGFFFRA
jgi:Ca2+/Na+ antiporter